MNSTKELHYRYMVSYLLIAIILLVALAYYEVPNLVDKFSFALTLSSLLLAVLAIFYTIISAQKQDIQLSKLVQTNTNLDCAADAIASAAEDIRLFAREAPQHFQAIGTKLDSITANYETLKTAQIQQVEDYLTEDAPVEITRATFLHMFPNLQFSAMAVLYLFERSSNKSKSIEPDTFKALEISSFDYAMGVLTGLETAGFLSFNIHKGAIVPIECVPAVRAELKNALLRVQEVVDTTAAERLAKLMSAIDAHVT